MIEQDTLLQGNLLAQRLKELKKRIDSGLATKKDKVEYKIRQIRAEELKNRAAQQIRDIKSNYGNKPETIITRKKMDRLSKSRIKTLKAYLKPKRPV